VNWRLAILSLSLPVGLLFSEVGGAESFPLSAPLPWWLYPLCISYAALVSLTSRLVVSKVKRARARESRSASLCYLIVGPLPGLTYVLGKIPSFSEPPVWVASALWVFVFASAGAYLFASQDQE